VKQCPDVEAGWAADTEQIAALHAKFVGRPTPGISGQRHASAASGLSATRSP